ncbi:MAG: hypothetical protein GEU86_22725 [Actinophytocola sp.]|nr:hypothetical protein [Actinophytocola sp.]
MKTYQAKAVREDGWWVVHVDGIGVTQGRSVAEARRMAPDLVAAVLDVDVESVEVDVEFDLPCGATEKVREARDATRRAAEVQQEAAEQQRRVVKQLKASGLSGTDVAAILGVSTQRVSQLARDRVTS